MAGGTFSTMNKKRPGAYINFESEPEAISYIGIRGITTMPFNLSWGGEDKLIELKSTDLSNINVLAKTGIIPTEKEALLINLAMQNCSTIKLYNTNKTGVKAHTTINDGLTVTAKYPGKFGNTIAIIIKAIEDSFIVETYANGYFADSQKVKTINELVANDFVEFSGDGDLQAIESTLLEDGANGTEMQPTEYLPKYFELLKATKWNTMACYLSDETSKKSVIAFIEKMRNEEGKYVQGVVANASITDADYEGIINVVNGIVLEDETKVTADQFTAWVAGATAGAEITDSLTGYVINGAVNIVDMLDNEKIIEALQNGKFVLSLNQNGAIKVEKDINSLHTFTADKKYMFSKNRIIRTLDEIGAGIQNIWENTYLGKVSNNEAGRTLFKSSIIAFLTELRDRGAIQDFDIANIIVEAGQDIDSVIASIAIKPVDSMEFLYMTVHIS